MSGLREYIEKRRDEIRKQMEPLEASTAELRTILHTAEAHLRALAKEATEIERALQAIGKRESRDNEITIKDAILKALAEAPGGLTSSDLLATINDRFFEGTLPRTSMSPQLTRLKNDDHKIKRRGERYFLA
jgi:hypothetical protein